MLRTRDLFLFGTVICFLLVAIGGTVLSRIGSAPTDAPVFNSAAPAAYTATIATTEAPTRAERLQAMREKVAAEQSTVALSAPVEDEVFNMDAEDASSTTPEPEEPALVTCPQYQAYNRPWNPSGIAFLEQEGARIVYRESTAPATASGTPAVDTLLQLPIRLFSDAPPQCIGSDVIGIAQDGSLIRNQETGLYSVFGAETLIGYALDGFPIYGLSSTETDECGGAIVVGQYRYFLSSERETVLGCFAAPPVMLP